ncbi:hypothetical protein P152DRAFT_121674 [Eremomyces bilateralis CBS 781.70]|uniref:Cns1/TTC4 wheel domain-containing protein n=1 Tax=Eremomyces bilateralis CBS 781.70 TaxID=1392243 RepID=A0A6G1GEB7_9PEZI|nr:uncharacterized protein P152DRAFT_121674 [Eremomyces bilateralis CBS 781.70]KAF1816393.1 hypothetical protein P152DRAFT_121674 [Eremomyces bilateralis CBS 781.70]
MTSSEETLPVAAVSLRIDEAAERAAQGDVKAELSSSESPEQSSKSPNTKDVDRDAFVPALPPLLADAGEKSIDEQLKDLQSHPMFMKSLPNEPNEFVEALQAMAYEGTRAEVAANFREQGNDCFKTGHWRNAAEFYTKAIDHLINGTSEDGQKSDEKGNSAPQEEEVEEAEIELPRLENGEPVLSPEEEKKVEHAHLLACLLNRSLCNLKLQNFRSASLDARQALVLDPSSLKGYYRVALAHYHLSDPNGPSATPLDHLKSSKEAANKGLKVHPSDRDLVALSEKLHAREKQMYDKGQKKIQQQQKKFTKTAILKAALTSRGWVIADTGQRHGRPDLEDAEIRLDDPNDPKSELSLPLLVLYPLAAQSDFLKQVSEATKIGEVIGTVLEERPFWDTNAEYAPEATECYAESAKGSMLKLGRKVKLESVLAGGKVVLKDGMLTLHVVPKSGVDSWLEEIRKRRQ